MAALFTCKNEEGPSIINGTTLYIDFSDVHGQITPESVVGSGRNSTTS